MGKEVRGDVRAFKGSYVYKRIKKPTQIVRAGYIPKKDLRKCQAFTSNWPSGSVQAGSEGKGRASLAKP